MGGRLHWTQEEGAHSQKVPAHPHQEKVHGEGQPQVHRHQLQVRPRSLPDSPGQDRLHGTAQEGQEGLISLLATTTRPRVKTRVAYLNPIVILTRVTLGELVFGK